MGRKAVLGVIALWGLISCACHAQDNNGFEIVRIDSPSSSRCINSKTDEVTLSVMRVTVEKTKGFFTSDNQAGIAVMTTANSDGQPAATTPSVNLLQIAQENNGQVFLPLEYPIASQLALTQAASGTTPATTTKNIALQMYLEKTRGANTFGNVLTAAGNLLGKMPIPSNPYLTVANQFLSFANQTIQNETQNSGAKLFASISLQFADRDISAISDCRNAGFQSTGAIAVIAATGSKGSRLLPLGNLNQSYCWRYDVSGAAEIQYAQMPANGCTNVTQASWAEPSNDYVMMLISAFQVTPPSLPHIGAETLNGDTGIDIQKSAKRFKDIQDAKKLCEGLKAPLNLCGVVQPPAAIR